MANPAARYALAQQLIGQAGRALRLARLEAGEILQKTGPQDLVTVYDRRTEQFFRQAIQAAFPGDSIVGEEYPQAAGDGGAVWYIDPIDGTTNFVNQHRNYAISVGCYQGGQPLFGLVLDVELDALFSAQAGGGAACNGSPIRVSGRRQLPELLLTTPGVPYTFLRGHAQQQALIRLAGQVRAVRSMGSVALELCQVAAGEADLFVAMRSSPWDHNAARIILQEAGGALCTMQGQPLPQDGPSTTILAANSLQTMQMAAAFLHGA